MEKFIPSFIHFWSKPMWDPYTNTKNNKLSWRHAHAIRLSFASLLVLAIVAKYLLMSGFS